MMTAETNTPVQSQARREPRTNLFAMGTIYTDGGSAPVRIRNLSPTGAMVEGGVLPKPGAQVRLRRGSLEVQAKAAWCKDGAAGLRFDSPVTVAEWLPRGRALAPQQRIDDVFHQARVGACYLTPNEPANPTSSRLGALELMRIQQAIESLAIELASDPSVVARYATKLQVLDIAAQALGKVASDR